MNDDILEIMGVIIIDVATCRPQQSCHTLPEDPSMKAIRERIEDLKRSAAEADHQDRKFRTLLQQIAAGRRGSEPGDPASPTDIASSAAQNPQCAQSAASSEE
mgnify:CR=1 FL=1